MVLLYNGLTTNIKIQSSDYGWYTFLVQRLHEKASNFTINLCKYEVSALQAVVTGVFFASTVSGFWRHFGPPDFGGQTTDQPDLLWLFRLPSRGWKHLGYFGKPLKATNWDLSSRRDARSKHPGTRGFEDLGENPFHPPANQSQTRFLILKKGSWGKSNDSSSEKSL